MPHPSSKPADSTLAELGDSRAVLDSQGRLAGTFVPFRHAAVQAGDHFEKVSTDMVWWTRSFRLKRGEPAQQVRLLLDFEAAHVARFALIPGISWYGNTNDPGNVYHGFEDNGVPWSFASHRTLIPDATCSEGDRHSIGMFHLALHLEGRQWKPKGGFSIGRASRNGELANGFLSDCLASNNRQSLQIGLRCLDAWAARVPAAQASARDDTTRRHPPGLAVYHGIAADANTLSDGASAFLLASRQVERPPSTAARSRNRTWYL